MSARPCRWRSSGAIAAALVALTAVSGCTSGDKGPPSAGDDVGRLPAAARTIMEKEPYKTARWIYYVADAETGKVMFANRPDEMVFTGSTAKEISVGTAYDQLGADTTLTTPVFATTPVATGVVAGDLALVASGDLALGGRNALQGKFDHTFYGTTVDHVYANIVPNATRVGDPLAGLDDLSRQIKARGVTRIDGDVRIDTSLFRPFEGQEGATPPIYVNDNILDLQVTATTAGQVATVEPTPRTAYLTVDSKVQTVAPGGETAIEAATAPDDPSKVVVTGTIAAGTSRLAIYPIEDAPSWARALFIEALQRAGITVNARLRAPNNAAGLRGAGSYPAGQELASLKSPTLSAMGRMILEISYNRGANTFMCLLAVKRGSTDCTEGLKSMYEAAEKAGMDTDHLFLVDGQGADPASTTPRQMTRWVQWARQQPWGNVFVEGQPVLAETGSLAPYGVGTPSAGKVRAKAGTSVAVDEVTGRAYFKVQSLSGYLDLDNGGVAAFALSMSGATFPAIYQGLVDAGADVAGVAAAFQQARV